jgi:hypothetical protein
MWSSLVKIQYTELKLSCENDPGFPCGRRRTLFILGSLPLYRLITLVSMPVKYFAPEVTETMYHSFFLLEITVVKIMNNLK